MILTTHILEVAERLADRIGIIQRGRVVAEGALDAKGAVKADNVLAKHDERYMPREVADALKKQGVWNEGQAQGQSQAKPAEKGGK